MRTLSLFSGVGGFDLGAERAGMEIVAQCEIDPFCRAVLAKHWPGVPCHDDVTTREFTKGEADAIIAGFPCQDVSNAGHRAGISGERSGLYRHVVRAVRVVRPIVAVLENVAALLVRGMGTVLGDLAEIGYDAEWDCVPASVVGALHHRDRIFITAVGSDAGGMRPQRVRATAPESWPWEQLEGLVQAEARVSVPAGASGGMADGVANRTHRLRGLGNAVYPAQAEVICRAVMESAR